MTRQLRRGDICWVALDPALGTEIQQPDPPLDRTKPPPQPHFVTPAVRVDAEIPDRPYVP